MSGSKPKTCCPCPHTLLYGTRYGNFDVFVRSSALDRSIMSGLCFFNGIFPDNVTGMEVNATQYLPSGAQVCWERKCGDIMLYTWYRVYMVYMVYTVLSSRNWRRAKQVAYSAVRSKQRGRLWCTGAWGFVRVGVTAEHMGFAV